MNRDLGKAADGGNALFRAAKIERALQAEGTQNLDIRLGEVAEMVGTEDLPPAHSPAIPGGIAPEIAEIVGAGEIEVAGRWVWHGVSLGNPVRRGNDWKTYRVSGRLRARISIQNGQK